MVKFGVGALGLSSKGHAILLRFVASFAIGTGLGYHVSLVIVHGNTNKTLLSRNVPTFCVSVDQSCFWFFPLSKASVFPFFINFAGIGTVEYGVEHDFGIITVSIGAGT